MESYKINSEPWPWQKDKKEFHETLKKVFKQTFINQFIVTPIAILIVGFDSKYIISSTIPPFTEILTQTSFFLLSEDFFFYITHRILHLPWFYKHIHKKHHEFKVTISIAAEYCHPIEYIFGNSIPFASGPLIYGQQHIHITTWFAWVFIRAFITSEGHSGYEVPWSPYAIIPFTGTIGYHDFHHTRNQGNYEGTFVFIDTFLKTNTLFWGDHEKEQKKVS